MSKIASHDRVSPLHPVDAAKHSSTDPESSLNPADLFSPRKRILSFASTTGTSAKRSERSRRLVYRAKQNQAPGAGPRCAHSESVDDVRSLHVCTQERQVPAGDLQNSSSSCTGSSPVKPGVPADASSAYHLRPRYGLFATEWMSSSSPFFPSSTIPSLRLRTP